MTVRYLVASSGSATIVEDHNLCFSTRCRIDTLNLFPLPVVISRLENSWKGDRRNFIK